MEGIGTKRKSAHNADGPHKAPKLAGGGGKMTFAQRMMAKMGYVEGQGLGKEGEGIVNPIEVKQRPQGAGVGVVKEKTAQAKEEEKRRAEARGDDYEDSSEEERRRRKERKAKGQGGIGSAAAKKKKVKYQTVADVQAAAPGLDVPATMLGSILDATGSTQKMLTSTAGLMLSSVETRDEAAVEKEKIEKRERLELEAFIDAWHGLQEQKIYLEEHEGQHAVEIEQMGDEIGGLTKLVNDVAALSVDAGQDHDRWKSLVAQLQEMQNKYEHLIGRYNLQEAAVAALHPVFKQELDEWQSLEQPEHLTTDISSISKLLLHNEETVVDATSHLDLRDSKLSRHHSTTAYESMIYTLWLPKIRNVIRSWDVLDYQPMIDIVQSWRPLLPKFIFNDLIDHSIVPKLTSSLQSWDPRPHKHHKHESVKRADPSSWIFPWLPVMLPYQMDAKEAESLIAEVKRRMRHVLNSWNVAYGVVPDLGKWKGILAADLDQMLIKSLLPRLAMHLSTSFEIDPSNQNLDPLEKVFAWQDYFKPDVMARLLAAEFFPKWLATLHLWLTSPDASFEEIGQWLAWWREQLPERLSQCEDVKKGWAQGNKMVNAAMDLLDAGKPLESLPRPAAGPVRPIDKPAGKRKPETVARRPGEQEAIDFKDAVESWCAEEDLTLLPLREAHAGTGLPLFRITASASGKGGVIVYLKGDVVWAQRKGDRTAFDPIGLEEALVTRAEGK